MLPRVLRKGSASLMTEESSGNTVKLSGKSYQAFATALGSKDLPSCTTGKLVGMVRMQRIGIIRSQVLQGAKALHGCSSETECRWVTQVA